MHQRTGRDPRANARTAKSRTPIAVLEQQRDRIMSISLDVNALNKSCSVEVATGFALPRLADQP